MKRLLTGLLLFTTLACAAHVYLGQQKVGSVYLGDQKIAKRYLGDQLIFDHTGTPESVLLTPAMTSNTSPAPFVVTSNISLVTHLGPAWHGFDQNLSTQAHSDNNQQNDFWLAVDLGQSRNVTRVKMFSRENSLYQNDTPSRVTVLSSADGVQWDELLTVDDIPQPVGSSVLFFDYPMQAVTRHLKFAFVNAHARGLGVQVIGEIRILGY
jgi:hypothetical protein